MKIYIDTQIKKLIEINKQNAKELERIKLIKTSTCQAHHIQSILSANPPSPSTKPNRIYSHQSSRPYLTFELDQIRRYQRQALLKSPYGTIPLYRRQAWVKIVFNKIKMISFQRQQLIYFPIIHYIFYGINKIHFECK